MFLDAEWNVLTSENPTPLKHFYCRAWITKYSTAGNFELLQWIFSKKITVSNRRQPIPIQILALFDGMTGCGECLLSGSVTSSAPDRANALRTGYLILVPPPQPRVNVQRFSPRLVKTTTSLHGMVAGSFAFFVQEAKKKWLAIFFQMIANPGPIDATCWCNIVAHRMLCAFGHHVAQCCVRLANPAEHVATWSNNVACNMLNPFGLGFRSGPGRWERNGAEISCAL